MALRALILALLSAGGAAAISKCSAEFSGLLADDPHGDPQAFLRCQGSSGAWQRQLCPGELVFDFVNQQCTTPERKTRQPSTLNIAILNNSCARGEQCIGGTICDPIQKKCLCPAGSIPVLETLSCEAKGGQNVFNPYNAKIAVPIQKTLYSSSFLAADGRRLLSLQARRRRKRREQKVLICSCIPAPSTYPATSPDQITLERRLLAHPSLCKDVISKNPSHRDTRCSEETGSRDDYTRPSSPSSADLSICEPQIATVHHFLSVTALSPYPTIPSPLLSLPPPIPTHPRSPLLL